ncbi:hypothetical protein RQP46_011411 [Phenoliferia psychrophenolica]
MEDSTIPTPEAQIASLRSVLSTLDRTQGSLPSLLRSFAVPTTSSSERASIYRERANEAWSSIKALSDDLAGVQAILDRCDASEQLDQVGIVVKPREVSAGAQWARLADVLGGGTASASHKGKEKATDAFVPQLGSPATPHELAELVRRWSEDHPRVTVELDSKDGGGKEQSELRITLRGTMRAVAMLHWSDWDGGGRCVLVERVACFGLKEEGKSSYLQSQHSLFQSISGSAMELISRSLRRLETADTPTSNVEEVLSFLSNPPLPF